MVELPEGDPMRRLASGALFPHLNRGKKSVTIGYDTEAGKAKLVKLISTADILLVSLPKEELQKLTLDYDTLKHKFPQLIFLHVSPHGYGCGGWHGVGAEFGPCYAAGAGLLDMVRPNARVPINKDDVPPPQLIPFWAEHAASMHVALGAAGALLHVQHGNPGQKVEVVLESVCMMFSGLYHQFLQHARITQGIDGYTDMSVWFPYQAEGIDKNFARLHGGVIIPGLQAYQCADGLWLNLLELDMMGPLPKIHDSLDPSGTGGTKRSAIANAVFTLRGLIDRVVFYVSTWRDAFKVLLKALPRDEAMAKLEAGGVLCIA